MTPAELLAIRQRELKNEQDRARWRQQLAAARARSEPAPRSVLEPTVIPMGPNGSVIFTGRGAMLRWGSLSIGFAKFDERQISLTVMRLQDDRKSWPDGTLRGVKRLLKTPKGWMSPTQRTLWENDRCDGELDESMDLRSHSGVHAVWADCLEELNMYPGRLVEVAGWGVALVGDLGWRAEHAKIVRELI